VLASSTALSENLIERSVKEPGAFTMAVRKQEISVRWPATSHRFSRESRRYAAATRHRSTGCVRLARFPECDSNGPLMRRQLPLMGLERPKRKFERAENRVPKSVPISAYITPQNLIQRGRKSP